MNCTQFRREIMKKIQVMKTCMETIMEPIAKEEGLTSLQLMVLFNIRYKKNHTVGALGKDIQMGQANASTLCKKLEKDGFLLRERSNEDERVVLLKLTDKGEQALKRVKMKLDLLDEKLNEIPQERYSIILRGFQEAEDVFKTLLVKDKEE